MAFGQGSPGMSPEIMQAMQRRGMGAPSPMASQVSPGQPGSVGAPPTQPAPAPQGQMPSGASGGSPQPQINSEAEMIVKALGDRLKGISQVERGSINTSGVGGGGLDSYVSHKIPILKQEGYNAPGQAYAVARSMYERK